MHEKITVCINGAFLPAEAALVSIADRGFRFGDGVFEAIRLVNGAPYQWKLHMARLTDGLAALRIPAPDVDWASMAQKFTVRAEATDGILRIAVSRGVGSRGYLPNAASPTWVMEHLPFPPLPETALSLWLSTIPRVPPAALPVNHKLAQGVNSTLALLEAQDHHCNEALQLTLDGHLCEAASANLFWLQNGKLYTPALGTGCLDGTTRAAVRRLSPIPCEEITAPPEALRAAEAVFITNARLGVWPVRSIAPLGLQFSTEHPVIAELQRRLAADYQSSTWSNA